MISNRFSVGKKRKKKKKIYILYALDKSRYF